MTTDDRINEVKVSITERPFDCVLYIGKPLYSTKADTDPVVGELIVQLDRKAERAEDDVGDDQAGDECVNRRVQSSVAHDDIDDDAVTAHADCYNDHVDQHDRYLQPQHALILSSFPSNATHASLDITTSLVVKCKVKKTLPSTIASILAF